MFNEYEIRKDFPILQTKMNGKPLVFLDNAASSQKPKSVIEEIKHYYEYENANIHRGVYELSQKATEKYEKVRIYIAKVFNAPCAKSIIFTRGTTESINIVAQVYGRNNLFPGDEILLSVAEHHSNLVPWQMVAQERGAKLKFLELDSNFDYDLSNLKELITEKTKIVSISQMSNVTGTIYNIKPIIQKAKEVGAIVVLDGAQGACHIQTNLKELDVDFYACSAHKMLGPTGIGILYGREEILESMPPWMGGGDMIETVDLEYSKYAALPAKLEAGTPNISGVMGFAKAIEYLENIGWDNIHNHDKKLMEYAIELISSIPGVEVYCSDNPESRGGLLSFNIEGVHPLDVGAVLDEEGIAIRVGHHCCMPLMKYKNWNGTCRASFYIYNTKEDVEALAKAIEKAKRLFLRFANV